MSDEPTTALEPTLKSLLRPLVKGTVDDSPESIEFYSHDASLFEVRPEVIVSPEDVSDIKNIVKFVASHKKDYPKLSVTARSGGTDMSGGAVNESILIDFTKHFNRIIGVTAHSAHVQPGVYYRNFEPETLKQGSLMPSFPASRDLCTVGGMVANNSGGEMSLRYGKTLNFVTELKAVLADGNEYSFRPLHKPELESKMALPGFEGDLYRKVFNLVDNHYEAIKAAKPHVTKNSTGYNLWDIWDRDTGIFDMTKALVGSQGTLGLVTDIHFKLIPKEPFTGVLVCFMKNTDELGEIINEVMKRKPLTFESFDNYTLNLSIKFFPYFRYNLGWIGLAKLGLQLIPDALVLFKGIPKLILLIEFSGATQSEVDDRIKDMHEALKKYKMQAMEDDNTPAKAWKFRIMRRESFNLLRKKVKDKHTAPYIDDLVVPPEYLPKFLPQLREIINKYKLTATVAGHMGDGNFHIIPLMKIEDPKERAKLRPSMEEVNNLVLKYHGSLSGEHNDGMIRGPWLERMYGPKVLGFFKELKSAFDPDDIFNPHKKTDADWDYSMSHIREHF
jgi:FAD/FMN-containing dehydrogenase